MSKESWSVKPRLLFQKKVGGEKLVAPSVKNAGSLQPREFTINNHGEWGEVESLRALEKKFDPGI